MSGGGSYPVPIYSGLLTPVHRERIGPAIWEFLWCINRTTKENNFVGMVLGGSPVTYDHIAQELGSSKSTVRHNMDRLEAKGYIKVSRTRYGIEIRVLKSKKFRVSKNGHSQVPECLNSDTLSAKIGHSKRKNRTLSSVHESTVDITEEIVHECVDNSKAENPVNALRDHYKQLFVDKTGNEPLLNFGQTGKLFKDMLKLDTEDNIKKYLAFYFSCSDQYYEEACWPLALFYKQYNAIKTRSKRKKETTRDYSEYDNEYHPAE